MLPAVRAESLPMLQRKREWQLFASTAVSLSRVRTYLSRCSLHIQTLTRNTPRIPPNHGYLYDRHGPCLRKMGFKTQNLRGAALVSRSCMYKYDILNPLTDQLYL